MYFYFFKIKRFSFCSELPHTKKIKNLNLTVAAQSDRTHENKIEIIRLISLTG